MSAEASNKAPDLQADVVIVGAGGAGMAAAIAAAEEGCKSIILVEKAGSPWRQHRDGSRHLRH